MFKRTKTDLLEGILYTGIGVVFLKSSTPLIVLTTFIVLCYFILQTNKNINTPTFAVSPSTQQEEKWSVAITNLVFRALTICIIGLLVWILIDKKSNILKSIF